LINFSFLIYVSVDGA